jgi:hypothetical protein
LLDRKKIKRKSSPWMRPEVDMHAGKKATCRFPAICVAIVPDLVGIGALEDVVRVVGVAEMAFSLPIATGAFEIVTNGDVHQQIGLLRHADVADFEIGAAVALTREHPLVSGGETSVVTNALQRPQDMVVRAGPIRSMMEAGVDVVPGTFKPLSTQR